MRPCTPFSFVLAGSMSTSTGTRQHAGQNFPGAAIFPRKYGRSVKLERPDILGKFVAATIFPGDDISCDTVNQHFGVWTRD